MLGNCLDTHGIPARARVKPKVTTGGVHRGALTCSEWPVHSPAELMATRRTKMLPDSGGRFANVNDVSVVETH